MMNSKKLKRLDILLELFVDGELYNEYDQATEFLRLVRIMREEASKYEDKIYSLEWDLAHKLNQGADCLTEMMGFLQHNTFCPRELYLSLGSLDPTLNSNCTCGLSIALCRIQKIFKQGTGEKKGE